MKEEMAVPESSYFIERSNDGIIIIQDGIVRFGNPKMIEMTGYGIEEAVGRPFIEFINPEFKEVVAERYRRRMAGKEVTGRYEIEILTKDGTIIPVEINASIIDYHGKPANMAIVRDISERKKAERELERNLQSQFIINQLLNTSLKNISFEAKLEEIIDQIITIPWLPIRKRGAIFTVEPGSEILVMKATRGRTEYEEKLCAEMPFDRCLCGRAARSGQIEFAETIDDRHDILYKGVTAHGHYCVPIKSGSEEIMGLFNIQLDEGHESDEEEMEFLRSAANVIGGIIERHRAEKEIENMSRFPSENPHPILRVAKDGTFAYANQSSHELLDNWNCEAGQCLPSELSEQIREIYKADSVKRIEVEHSDRIFSFEAIPLVDKGYVNLYGRDITESKKAEIEINKLFNAVEQSADILFIADRDGNIEYVNPSFEIVTGYSKTEAIGKTPRILKSGLMHDHYYETVWKTIRSGEVIRAEVLNRRKNEELFYYDQTITPIKDENGNVTHFVSTGKDVTERKRMEETMKLLDKAVESSINGIVIADLEGRLTYVNPSFVTMWGYDDRSEVLGRTATELWREPHKALETLGRLQVDGKYLGEMSAVKRDGTIFEVQLAGSMIFDENETPINVMASFVDITEKKLAEEELLRNYRELKKIKDELEKAYRELKEAQVKLIQSEKLAGMGTLAAGVAHEINNPLQMIIGMSEMILEDEDPGQVSEDAREILEASDRIQQITENLTSYSRNVKTMENEPVNLNDIIEKSIGMSRFSASFRQMSIDKELNELPEIHGNPGELQQVFINLFQNAAHAMGEEGTLTIRTEFEDDGITVYVTDTGKGIPREDLARIFDPFFTTKEVGKGTGLGLYIIHQIMEKYNGVIEVESEVGKGTTFTLRFPTGSPRRVE